ncbi:hypothetical protein STRDD11_02592 [Streptococcus sp. DD11]|uniref:hypothetical protein n=1 Tax=Streptococcus sp. DD11 TaxID=1777879 RepID=UPI0007941635|nr:hypothetical protein [Streptococcus sp. DD11]KXT77532.1 hypothetical protein STRDD11_02592 [Streptococcus sp. DD11]
MESKDVSWEDVSKKAQELNDFEDEYRLEKISFEARCEELDNRAGELRSLVDAETDRMSFILQRFSASSDDAADYFSEMENLLWRSEQAYKRRLADLEEEEDKRDKAFRRKRDRLEEEYSQLRRDYYAHTD